MFINKNSNSIRVKLFLLLLIFISLTDYNKANEVKVSNVSFKYNLSICAIIKNEAKYLKKWIDHHRNLGVDHFYLYDLGSKDSSKDVLAPYILDNLITLINWPEAVPQPEEDSCAWELCTQIPAYENALNFVSKNNTKWLIFLDVDEFLTSTENSLKQTLDDYDQYSGLSLSTINLDGSTEVILPKQKIANFCDAQGQPIQVINKLVAKMIIKPDQCEGFQWPPYRCKFKNQNASRKIDKQKLCINRYVTRSQ